jgi:hypothetical protein
MKKLLSVIPMAFLVAILLPACDKDKEKPVPVPDPEISFTASKDAGSSPVRVDFNNTTTNSENVSWNWNFGDDSTSTEKNPKHYYYAPGTYTVKLTAGRDGKTFPALTQTIQVEPDPTLRAWFKLDGIDDIMDAGGTGNKITQRGGYEYLNIAGRKGINNTAVELTGSNSVISLNTGLVKDQTTDANLISRTTISMWIYPMDLNGHHGLFLLSSTDATAYVPVLFTADNQLRGMFWDNPEATFLPMNSGAKTLSVNKWHHIALAGDERGQSLYLDGVNVGSRDKPITHLNMLVNYLGTVFVRPGDRWFLPQPINTQASHPFRGRIDDVRIYHKRLTDIEIMALSKE